jgi:hypothetical protein
MKKNTYELFNMPKINHHAYDEDVCGFSLKQRDD